MGIPFYIQHRTRQQVLQEIKAQPATCNKFKTLTKKYQEDLLAFAMGEQGLHITYDTVFQKILDPEEHPERLEGLLSAILERDVQIVEILDREGIHMTENAAFVIMDIIVKDGQGDLLNLEMQKIGYKFPLERSDCYTADLIMRQYDRLKKEKGDSFYFSQLSKVVSIVIMETSFGEFLNDHDHTVHHRHSVFDTGLPADGLTENYYICLDIYRKYLHTKEKSSRDAWLSFLASASLQDILGLCDAYPEFIPIYEEVFQFQKDVKEMVDMFSEALVIMNHNTERLMIEEMRMEIEDIKKELETKDKELESKDKELKTKDKKLESKDKELESKNKELEDSNKKLLEAKKRQFGNVQKIMDSMGKTVEEAMDFLDVDISDRPDIINRVKESSRKEKSQP